VRSRSERPGKNLFIHSAGVESWGHGGGGHKKGGLSQNRRGQKPRKERKEGKTQKENVGPW